MKKCTSSILMATTLVAGAATFVSLGGPVLDGRWGGNPVLAYKEDGPACPPAWSCDRATYEQGVEARVILQAYGRTKEDIAS
jgi:hypothetical protein